LKGLQIREMVRHDYPAGFPVRPAVKDLELVREVAESAHVEMPMLGVKWHQGGPTYDPGGTPFGGGAGWLPA
jgi:hypothetical protein